MANLRISFRDGSEDQARSYRCDGGDLRLLRPDGEEVVFSLETVDFERTFRGNADIDFDPPPGPPDKEPALELVASSQTREGDFTICSGVVRNISPVDLVNVVARAVVTDADGTFVTAEEALIDWNPLHSGGESPFRVLAKGPDGSRLDVTFRVLVGGELEVRAALENEADE